MPRRLITAMFAIRSCLGFYIAKYSIESTVYTAIMPHVWHEMVIKLILCHNQIFLSQSNNKNHMFNVTSDSY